MKAVAWLAWAALTGAAVAARAQEGPTPPRKFPPRLRVEGPRLKDPQGRPVVLRGVNKPLVDAPDGFWDAPGAPLFSGIGRWDPAAVGAALREIRAWGCNAIRFHTCVQWWKENPRAYRDRWREVTYPKPYREMLRDTIALAGEQGLYVIFDFYNLKPGSGQESLPWPPHAGAGDVVAGRGEFLDLWKDVAGELSSFPHVLFELYNEPHGDRKAEAEWMDFTQEAVNALRRISENVIVVQWDYGCWVSLDFPPPEHPAATLRWIEEHPLKGDHLLYSTHLYRNSGGAGNGRAHRTRGGLAKSWERDELRRAPEIFGVRRLVQERGKPLVVGEVGAHMRQSGIELERELQWFGNVLSLLNEWGLGYLAWAWHPDRHLEHGLLRDGGFFSGPNEAGRILMESLRRRP